MFTYRLSLLKTYFVFKMNFYIFSYVVFKMDSV